MFNSKSKKRSFLYFLKKTIKMKPRIKKERCENYGNVFHKVSI
jgi:hypothetical protein